MRHKPRRFTAALIVFSLFFQLLPLPALANGGRRSLIRAPEPTTAGALHASPDMKRSSLYNIEKLQHRKAHNRKM